MHIAFFSDQHPATLGGLQVSLGLQRHYLEQLGHTVTVCSPDSKCKPSPQYSRPEDITVRSFQFGDHAFHLAGGMWDREIDAKFEPLPPVDLVHIQADVWGAWNGYAFAQRHNIPLVHTMHTNIEVGLPAVVPCARLVFPLLFAAQRHYMQADVDDMSSYVRAFAAVADRVIVPTEHFAKRLRSYGVTRELTVIPTGVDDRQIDSAAALPRSPHSRPIFVWPGRVSEEKRLVDTIRAFAASRVDAELHVYGSGPEERACVNLVAALGISHRVAFHGSVSHDDVMKAMALADAVLQSSIGYETQGLTVYEAISVGTPVIVRDPEIAEDLPEAWCHRVADESIQAFADTFRYVTALWYAGTLTDGALAPTQFRQSHLTGRIVDVYTAALQTHEHQLTR
ncbi:glycosyltransferase [Schaalia sp. ZJ405]|uniref:glycosyltransferase n=1 Tax=Schaalia sp. ZJ405 TaxID=2709403 RepID=UPI0013EDFEC0|nr:glycosyltransferase [Schaalia sp. ZJ405]QPK81190.1 glycosyltransferase [Schaalia sp. ZJ405]